MKKYILLATLLSLNLPILAQGQDYEPENEEHASTLLEAGKQVDKDLKLAETFQKTNYTPFGGGPLSNMISNISLTSTLNDGQNGKAELKYSKNWWTAGITVDQKIGKNDDEATPFDLNGLSPGTTVEFNLQKMFWNPALSERGFRQFQRVKEAYVESRQGRERAKLDPRTVTVQDILDEGSKDQQYMARQIRLKQPVFINIKYAFTKTEFTYTTDSVTLNKTKEDHLTPSFSMVVGLPIKRTGSVNSYLALTYNYSVSYKKASDMTFYVPFGTTSNFTTQTIAFGKPKEQIDNKINVEWRANLGIKFSSEKTFSIGIAPSTTFGFNSKKVAAYLPVYFINGVTGEGKPKGLQGGFRFGYETSVEAGKGSSFKEGFSTQLIISAPFDVFGSLR